MMEQKLIYIYFVAVPNVILHDKSGISSTILVFQLTEFCQYIKQYVQTFMQHTIPS